MMGTFSIISFLSAGASEYATYPMPPGMAGLLPNVHEKACLADGIFPLERIHAIIKQS